MSPPSPSRTTPQTPLSPTTSTKTKMVRFQEREMMAANALVALSTADTMSSNKASTPAATNANSGKENVTAEPSKHIEMADNAVEIPEGGIQLRVIGPPEEDEEDQSKDPVKVRKWIVEGNAHRLDPETRQERKDDGEGGVRERGIWDKIL